MSISDGNTGLVIWIYLKYEISERNCFNIFKANYSWGLPTEITRYHVINKKQHTRHYVTFPLQYIYYEGFITDTLTEKRLKHFSYCIWEKAQQKQKEIKVAIQARTLHHTHSASFGIHFGASFKCKYKTGFVKPYSLWGNSVVKDYVFVPTNSITRLGTEDLFKPPCGYPTPPHILVCRSYPWSPELQSALSYLDW
jgi:hypothetical protein